MQNKCFHSFGSETFFIFLLLLWFCSLIFQVSVVLRKAIVAGGDWRFNNQRSHHQSQLNNVVSLVMTQVVKKSVTTWDNSPSQDYIHLDNQAT